ncbi:MAG: ATP-binding cassette domain-containing protein [Methanomicrobiales archaeon]|nr:ATP-binding cassette domain-containing protein [Methanomicrobiales archaeon]MDD1646293.1 ATP-binding cassette domain-containing protein [Methanomicrobiales archaeon]
MSRIILEARDVRYRYPGGVDAIRGMSFHVRQGEKVALVGPNGAGKSTLLLMFNGMLRPDSGTLLFDNEPLRYDAASLRELRRRVGFVFQNPDRQIIAPTVYQDVAFGPVNLGYPEEKVRTVVGDALRNVGLEGFERRPPHRLSAGEKKRVAIAGVLAMDPDLLVLDEPTSSLDPAGSEDTMELMEELHQAGKTIILSTHDVELAYPWADRAILLRQGEILQEDVPEVAFGDPDLVRRARLSVPVLLELYQELARRGLPLPGKRPKTSLDMIHLIEQAFSRGGRTGPCGTIHVCDVDRTGPDALACWLSTRDGIWIGAMGTRAKQRAAEGKITLDFTYGVIDKCLLRALGGESSLILTAGGMVQRVEVRVRAFSGERGTAIPVEEVKEP